jgi:hypothetical protein
MVFLEDVQKDDVIEYSYTIKGFNPIFKGRFSNVLETNFSVPVYQIYYKLLSSNNRHLQFKNSNTDVKPLITTGDTLSSYEWKLNNIPAFHTQDHLPSWYDPYATVMISDFLNWKEVNEWALSLFPSNVAFSSALLNKIHEIKLHHNDPYNQTAAALRFVQDEIRYLGIEMGENSHRPHSPDQILKQRFGDCKDKSYLLCTLLKGLGIEAHPVLINTTYKGTIREWLPTPTAFDHTTVRVKIDNRFYWFDPTLSFQRGPIHTISFPDYQAGLVVTDTTVQITTIPCLTKGAVHVKERFDIKDMSGRVKLTVTSHYSGSFAYDTRSEFKNNSRYEMSKTYQDFYAGYFKNIKADSLTTQDEEKTGSFTTIEYYTIDSLCGPYAYMKKASFEPFVINGLMTKPTHEKRTMPFRLKYPAHYKEQVEINLPEIWNAKQSSDQTETSAFKLTTDFSCTGKQVLLNYDYVALKDHIMPDEADSYLRNMKKAENEIAYELSHTTEIDTAPAFTGKSSGYGFLYVALGLCVFITYNLRRQNKINRY